MRPGAGGSQADREFHENEIRKDFAPSERVAIADTIRKATPERRGNPAIRKNFCGLEGGRTDGIAANRAGIWFTIRISPGRTA